MATTLEDLEHRMTEIEQEMKRLARLVADPGEKIPTDGTLDQWLARQRDQKWKMPLDEMRRAVGISPDLKPIHPRGQPVGICAHTSR